MRTRLVIFSAQGEPMMGIDIPSGHGVDRTHSTLEANLRLFVQHGHTDLIVIEFHPRSGADTALQHNRALHRMRLSIHTTPQGQREIVDLVHFDGDSVGAMGKREQAAVPTRVAQSFRVLAAPADVINPRFSLRGRTIAAPSIKAQPRVLP